MSSVYTDVSCNFKMKNLILILSLIFFGCNQSNEDILTRHKWKITGVKLPSVDKKWPENFDFGEPWVFEKNHIAKINDIYFIGGGVHEGEWELIDDVLTVKINDQEFKFKVKNIGKNDLTLELAFDEKNDLIYILNPIDENEKAANKK